ncbi:MAG: DsrE/DsrF/DrsH-like family protein [Dehalococcoidia bacterium]
MTQAVSEDLKKAIEEVLEERERTKQRKIALVASKGTLDWAYPPLVLATTAAALGWEVGIFFTFYGLNILHKDRLKKLPVTAVGNPAMPGMQVLGGEVSPPAIMTILPGMVGFSGVMMKQIFNKNNISSITSLMDTAIEAEVKLFPCSMTMAAFNIEAKDIIEGAQDPCGATTFLDYAKDADVIMFI